MDVDPFAARDDCACPSIRFPHQRRYRGFQIPRWTPKTGRRLLPHRCTGAYLECGSRRSYRNVRVEFPSAVSSPISSKFVRRWRAASILVRNSLAERLRQRATQRRGISVPVRDLALAAVTRAGLSVHHLSPIDTLPSDIASCNYRRSRGTAAAGKPKRRRSE